MTALPFPDSSTWDRAARAAARRFPVVPDIKAINRLTNHGGFSGAMLWRMESERGTFCLRSWPPVQSLADFLPRMHGLMAHAQAGGLSFVPLVYRTAAGATCVRQADRLWDLTAWMPGRADFQENPQPWRIARACEALARLHEVWKSVQPTTGPCPAMQRRLHSCHEWADLIAQGWRPRLARDRCDVYSDASTHAWRLLGTWMPRVPALLAPWAEKGFPLQPCHCDPWHDHVLFEGDEIRGLLDYGSVKTDQVAVDLARLLGSMAADNPNLWTAGLEGYRAVRPFLAEEEALAHVLDRTGTALALANWMKWLYLEGRVYADRGRVAQRLAGLVARVESWV